MQNSDEIEFLRHQALLKNFTDDELHLIRTLLTKKEYQQNDIILNEGDISSELCLLEKGEVLILKWDDEHTNQLPLGRLKEGAMFGEMSFIDFSPRTASVKAVKESTIWILSRADFEKHRNEKTSDLLYKALVNIASINIDRLRDSNKSYMVNLRSGLRQLQLRNETGELLIPLSICLGFIRFLDMWIQQYYPIVFLNWLDWSYWLIVLVPVIILLKTYHFYPDQIGLVFVKPKEKLLQTLFMIIASILVVSAIGWIINETVQIDLKSYLKVLPHTGFSNSLYIIGPVYFIYCCIKELISRGVILSSIKRFTNDESGNRSIFYTSALLALVDLPLGIGPAILTFIAGIFLGKVFIWQNTLLGVVLIHFCVGLFMIYNGMI